MRNVVEVVEALTEVVFVEAEVETGADSEVEEAEIEETLDQEKWIPGGTTDKIVVRGPIEDPRLYEFINFFILYDHLCCRLVHPLFHLCTNFVSPFNCFCCRI